ncbi:MAG: ScyD/ScyE family protein [Acidobacteriota bacterium]
MMTKTWAAAVCAVAVSAVATTEAARAAGPVAPTVFISGLKAPSDLVVTPRHNILVSEAGEDPPLFVTHEGRISIVDPAGNVRTLLGKLPSALDGENAGPAGPNGLWLQGERTLYVLMSVGDVLKRNAQNQEVPNPAGLSSSLFSSVWRIRFSEGVDWLADGFVLNPATDYPDLADGRTVVLTNGAGEHAHVTVLADIRDLVPGPVVVSASNPYRLTGSGDAVYFTDAGYNAVTAVGRSGRIETITHFALVPNTAGFGPPVSQAVPTGIRLERGHPDRALVTLFTGFPLGRGASSVREVDLSTGAETTVVSGLTMAIDALPWGHGAHGLLVLEHASGFVPPGPVGPAQFLSPGRVLRYATPTSAPEVLVNTLTRPTSMVLDDDTGDLYILERFTGRILKVALR